MILDVLVKNRFIGKFAVFSDVLQILTHYFKYENFEANVRNMPFRMEE